jgi:hypothetical protein
LTMDRTAFDLLDEMGEGSQQGGPDCPVCRLVSKKVTAYLDAIAYENVNDLGVREELRSSLGYCAAHGQEWLKMRNTLATALIYRDVLGRVLSTLSTLGTMQAGSGLADGAQGMSPSNMGTASTADTIWAVGKEGTAANSTDDNKDTNENVRMDAAAHADSATEASSKAEIEVGLLGKLQNFINSGLSRSRASKHGKGRSGTKLGRRLAAKLEPTGPCPCCQYTVRWEADAVASFAAALANSQFIQGYGKHISGLCLPHFRQALCKVDSPRLVRGLADAQVAKLTRSSEELAKVLRKYDYRFRKESPGEEFSAPARSVEQMAGGLPTQLNTPKRR